MPIAASAQIHPSAIVDPQADIGANVQIGPHVLVEGAVSIGHNCIIRAHACLLGSLTLGSGNDIGFGAIIGDRPQHLGYKNENTRTVIGNGNVIREHVTIHRGTPDAGTTRIGDNNYLMANAHIGHDCRLGNRVMMVNGILLGGHCVVEDQVLLSGNSVVHQFTRLGRLSMSSGLVVLTQDLPPFMLAPERNTVSGINKVGMRRAGLTGDDVRVAQKAYKTLYRSGLMQKLAVQELEQELGEHPIAAEILTFIRGSKRGFIRPREQRDGDEQAEAA